MNGTPALRLENITKRFGSVVANNGITMDVRKGEILALLGENGSGKTTLMNMLSGIYYPDDGSIYVGQEEAHIRSPQDAFDYGIGMIHQHFKLVDVFTAAENVILGIKNNQKYDLKLVKNEIKDICGKYGFEINPDQKVYNMSVSQKQTLEIIKVLYRGAEILILDEPTAVLTPQETDKLFQILRAMREDGKSVIIITHKLHEVLDISDRVAILRRGEYVDTVDTKSATEQTLSDMMVGKKTELNIDRSLPVDPKLRLSVKNITCINEYGLPTLSDVSFDVFSGEILGIAGISGCGQKELLEAIAGLQRTEPNASVMFYPPDADEKKELIGCNPKQIRELGVSLSFVPEDRLGMGLVGSMGMTDNMLLKNYGVGHSAFVQTKDAKLLAEKILQELEVVTPGINTPVRRLSGGNVQKVLVGREIAASPKVLMTAYAVRGLDINTSYTIYRLLNQQKEQGVAVIYVGEDLDVLLALCDRILVLCGGRVNGIVDARTATKEEIGLLMTNLNTSAVGSDNTTKTERKDTENG
ncbi:MAG: ABC transporter ATP-binding protein [Clostridia bacterium]|nr:ABC transporter ATP-binding protein [Clostridia bacterium]